MIKLFISTTLLSLFAAIPSFADQTDDYLLAEMAKHKIPGAVLKVIRDGKEIKMASFGFANLELQVKTKPETVFEIGSITKQFTATCILLLQQDGKLSVDDKIGKYLRNIPDTWTNVTVSHLLTHTSGIKSYTGLSGFELTQHFMHDEFIRALASHPLEFQPGDSWKYSNSGYSLLGYIVENVSEKKYWEFLRERILRPLGMNSTTDRNPQVIITNRADGYERKNEMHINRDYDLTDVFSAGAIVSTVGDLAKWNAALDSDKLLTPASKEVAWKPQYLNDGKATKYGFGWFIDTVEGHSNVGHGGSTSGFSASLQRFPDDKLAVILLTNTDEQIATTRAKKIATFYFQGGGGSVLRPLEGISAFGKLSVQKDSNTSPTRIRSSQRPVTQLLSVI